jgi:hypothetical protein
MHIRKHDKHPVMSALPGALRARMDSLGHDQIDVEAATGVPQPQISRALNGTRKRLTPPMIKLCRYAELGDGVSPGPDTVVQELSVLLQHVIGDSASAAAHMKAVLRSLAPIMADYRRRTETRRR